MRGRLILSNREPAKEQAQRGGKDQRDDDERDSHQPHYGHAFECGETLYRRSRMLTAGCGPRMWTRCSCSTARLVLRSSRRFARPPAPRVPRPALP
jgi:hypothetical protein